MSRLELRPASQTERQLAVLWSAAVASALALRPLWIELAPLLRPCAFRRLTGIPCPTCGTTRTALALLDLDLRSALLANPLAAAVGIAFVGGGLIASAWWVLRLPLPATAFRWSRRWSAAVVAALLANWVYLVATH